jgi:hypothetical protein
MKTSVSVVMCVRNVEKYIGNCIRLILDQTFNDFEIVMIDDLQARATKCVTRHGNTIPSDRSYMNLRDNNIYLNETYPE